MRTRTRLTLPTDDGSYSARIVIYQKSVIYGSFLRPAETHVGSHRSRGLKRIRSGFGLPDSAFIYFFRATSLRPAATYVAEANGKGSPRLLEPSQPSKYENLGITPEVAHFKGKDGLALAGILYKPAGYEPGKRYPAVIWAHGGPEGQVVLSLNPWSLFLTQQGYVVLEPNFRAVQAMASDFATRMWKTREAARSTTSVRVLNIWLISVSSIQSELPSEAEVTEERSSPTQ